MQKGKCKGNSSGSKVVFGDILVHIIQMADPIMRNGCNTILVNTVCAAWEKVQQDARKEIMPKLTGTDVLASEAAITQQHPTWAWVPNNTLACIKQAV